MSDQYHVAYPKLYGAPAYARPPRPALPDPRPLDPDDLPIEADRTAEEQILLESGGQPPAAPDDSTFVVTLAQPTAYFLTLTTFYTFMPVPRHVVERWGVRWDGKRDVLVTACARGDYR